MEQTWYLALDMQLFILSPLFIYMLWRRKNIGLALLAFVFLGTIGANFAIFAVFDLMPTIMPTRTYDPSHWHPCNLDKILNEIIVQIRYAGNGIGC